MVTLLEDLRDVEDFFHYYQIPYDSHFVLVKRLHIMKRFRSYLEEEQLLNQDPEDREVWEKQRFFLIKAYQDTLHFQQMPAQSQEMPWKAAKACSGCHMHCEK